LQLDESGALAPAAFRMRVDAELARAARYEQKVAIVVVAVPQLPLVKVEQGPEQAARLARTVVEMLRLSSRRFDCVGRLGPDRFAVLLPQADQAGALARLHRLRLTFERFPMGAHGQAKRSQQLGIRSASVSYPQDAQSPSELVEAAERAVATAIPQEGSGGML
jgi:diguanylate cyclase (GGDEF)-like protein